MTLPRNSLIPIVFSFFFLTNIFVSSGVSAQTLDAQSKEDLQAELKKYVEDVGKQVLQAQLESGKFKIPTELYNLKVKFNKAQGRVEKAKQQLIDFKNADKFAKVRMRCGSDLSVMKKLASTNGIDLKDFLSVRTKACDQVVKLGKLKKMYEDFQMIKKNGFLIVDKHTKRRVSWKIWPDKRKRRTTQKWVRLAYVPGAGLKFTVHYKWSDKKKRQIIPLPGQKRKKKGWRCLPPTSKSLKLCFAILDTSKSMVKLKWLVRADAKYIGWFDIPDGGITMTVPAPFGYLEHLDQFKEEKKLQAYNKIVQKISDTTGIEKEQLEKIKNLASMKMTKADMQKKAQEMVTAKLKEMAEKTAFAKKYTEQIEIAKTLYNISPKELKPGSPRKGLKEFKVSFANMDKITKIKTLCNTQIPPRLAKALTRIGVPLDHYASKKTELCSVLRKFGEIQKMYEDWKHVSKDGLHLANEFRKNKPKFKGKRRTVQFGIEVRYMAEQKKMKLYSWYKFSGDKKQTKEIRNITAFTKPAKKACKYFKSRGKLCWEVLKRTKETITVKFDAESRYRNRTKGTTTGPLKINIPYAYMDKLAVMKGKAQKVLEMKKQMQSLVAMDASFHKKMAEVSKSLD
jgi:hypothetical protein